MNKPILNKLLITTAFPVLAMALAGCAGSTARPTYVDQSTLSPEEYADAVYVARVERIARMRGIDLTWVNAPNHLPANPTKVVAIEEEAP